jgi:multidrug resistance efflux pump
MEQLQAELAEMRRQNENQMAQFMQAIAGLTQGQAELRNLV